MAAQTHDPHPLSSRAVVGLEGSRKTADRHHRRRRFQQRLTSSVMIAILIGAAVAAAFVAYTMYTEQSADEQVERDRRVAELEVERDGRTTDDLIEQLENTPRWNGPGAPAFGVGEEPVGIEVTSGLVTDG